MGVAPNLTIRQKHYGSTYAMTDYTTDAHTIYLTANFMPSSKARIHGSLSYVASTAALDVVEMPDVTEQLQGDLTHQDFTFLEMDSYSDLDYKLLKVSLGLEMRLSQSIVWTADTDFADLTDDAAYVYGDESGSLFLIRSGFRFDF